MDNAEIIAIAVRDVPAAAFQTRPVADMAVANLALRVREQVDPRSLAMRTLAALPILATIDSIVAEESSKRLLVTFRPDFQREGFGPTETIRSDRTDGRRGESVRRMWAGLEGHHVRIYKTVEETGDPQRPRVRVAPFVEVVGDDADERA